MAGRSISWPASSIRARERRPQCRMLAAWHSRWIGRFEHLLRRAGFGARPDELDLFRTLSIRGAVEYLVDYERIPDDVDGKIGQARLRRHDEPGGEFRPASNIVDARQRWLFRMVHSNRPLQEKMTLFWHNHFATAYTKIDGHVGADRGRAVHGREAVRGSRQACAGRSRCSATTRSATSGRSSSAIAQDTAMLVLARRLHEHAHEAAGELRPRDHGAVHDGRRQLHRGRRVCGRARVHRLEPARARIGRRRHPALRVRLQRRASTRPTAKTFSFPDLSGRRQDDSRPRRPPTACRTASISSRRWPPARTPARYLATKLYRFFVSESGDVERRRS